MNAPLLLGLLMIGSVAVILAIVGLVALDGYRMARMRRKARNRLRAISDDPSQEAGA